MRIAPCPLSKHNHSHCLMTFAGGDVQAIFSSEAEPQVLGHSSSSSPSSSSLFSFERLPLNLIAASLSHLCRNNVHMQLLWSQRSHPSLPSVPSSCVSPLLSPAWVSCRRAPRRTATRSSVFRGAMMPGAGEKVSACGSLCSGETRVNSQGEGDLFNLFGDLAPPLITSPTSFPRPVEFKEFGMIQQKSSLGMFAAFQRMGTPLGTEVGYVYPGAMHTSPFTGDISWFLK